MREISDEGFDKDESLWRKEEFGGKGDLSPRKVPFPSKLLLS